MCVNKRQLCISDNIKIGDCFSTFTVEQYILFPLNRILSLLNCVIVARVIRSQNVNKL